jgi:hypothetical protein
MTSKQRETVLDSAKVESKGGNQYAVTITSPTGTEIMRSVDMDGIDIIGDEDYKKLVNAGLDADYMLTVDQYSEDLGNEEYQNIANQATAEFVLNYSGFDVDDFIKNNK